MHFTTLLTALLSTLPTTLSAPSSALINPYEPYQCGYVLTARNSSSYAGLSAFGFCTAIYYNHSIPGYQDAFAYRLWGGCECSFHVTSEECETGKDARKYVGPTQEKKDPLFESPKPMWYNCGRIA